MIKIIILIKSEVQKMVKKKYIAPNLITAGNMFLGYLSITESIKGNYTMQYYSFYLLWFVMV